MERSRTTSRLSPAGEADGVGGLHPGLPEVGVAGLDLRDGQPFPLPEAEVYQALQRLGLESLSGGDGAGGLHRPGEWGWRRRRRGGQRAAM
jgi:hypothetical protein